MTIRSVHARDAAVCAAQTTARSADSEPSIPTTMVCGPVTNAPPVRRRRAVRHPRGIRARQSRHRLRHRPVLRRCPRADSACHVLCNRKPTEPDQISGPRIDDVLGARVPDLHRLGHRHRGPQGADTPLISRTCTVRGEYDPLSGSFTEPERGLFPRTPRGSVRAPPLRRPKFSCLDGCRLNLQVVEKVRQNRRASCAQPEVGAIEESPVAQQGNQDLVEMAS